MKVDIHGETFELRKLTIKDREILKNECIILDDKKNAKFLSGTAETYYIILGCKKAPFFESVIPDALGVTQRLISDRLKEYYSMPEKYELLLTDLLIKIKEHNDYNPQDAEEIQSK